MLPLPLRLLRACSSTVLLLQLPQQQHLACQVPWLAWF
jgi:hypothetical protein